jgi:hypothetical protein
MTTNSTSERRKARATRGRARQSPAGSSGDSSPDPRFPMYELASELLGPGLALSLSQAHALSLVHWLEPWAVFLRAYRTVLNDPETERSDKERRARFLKELGRAYVQYLDDTGRTDSPLLAGRKEVVDAWLRLIEATLASVRPRRR